MKSKNEGNSKRTLIEALRIIHNLLLILTVVSFVMALVNMSRMRTYTLFEYGSMMMKADSKLLAVSVPFMIMCVSFLIAMTIKRCIFNSLRSLIMGSITHEIKNFKYIPNGTIPIGYFHITNFIKDYDKYTSKEIITGKIADNRSFIMSEILVEKIYVSEDGRRVRNVPIFDGLFGILDAKKVNTFYMDIVPDVKNKFANRVVTDFRKMLGNKNVVRLENAEFERYFEVHSDNQIESRKIITLEFMERLLEVRKSLGKNITAMYIGNKIFLFVQHGKLVNTKKMMWCGANKKMIDETSGIINKLFEAIELL